MSNYRFDLQKLDGETNGDNGLTILNTTSNYIPAPGSLSPDLMELGPNKIKLNSGPVGNYGRGGGQKYCTFDLDANSGKIHISMEDMPTNQWAKKTKNGKTYAENTRDFLKNYILAPSVGPSEEDPTTPGGRRRHRITKKKRSRRSKKTRKSRLR